MTMIEQSTVDVLRDKLSTARTNRRAFQVRIFDDEDLRDVVRILERTEVGYSVLENEDPEAGPEDPTYAIYVNGTLDQLRHWLTLMEAAIG